MQQVDEPTMHELANVNNNILEAKTDFSSDFIVSAFSLLIKFWAKTYKKTI